MDGRDLPRFASGVYATAVWGMLGLVAIEVMVVLSLVTSWFYLRFHNPRWPPPGIELPDVWMPAVRTLLLVGSAVCLAHAARTSFSSSRLRLAEWVLGSAVLVAVYLAMQTADLAGLDHDWQEHAYSSMYWTLSGYAAVHALTMLGLQVVVGGLTAADRLGPREPVALQVTAIYGIFVAVSAVLTWLTLNVAPHLL